MSRLTLTFDNGPTQDVTPGVLDLLAERQLSAWFCVVGRQLQKPGAPALVARALAEGHRVVNHSMNHTVPLGDDPSQQHAQAEVVAMHELMTRELGHWGDPWFRPFGRGGSLGRHVFSRAAVSCLEALEYSVLMWNSVPGDWRDPQGWVDTALGQLAGRNHTVIVLHDLPTGAMANLPRFLDEVDKRKIEITNDVPDDCVPVRRGRVTRNLSALLQ